MKFIPAPPEASQLEPMLDFKDEGVFPGLGTFHMYHRIDGVLVAIGIFDITNSIMNSDYFIYRPDYSFLTLGVVGALIEM